MKPKPFQWLGGKYRLADKIIGMFPSHKIYVEVCGGSASILFSKPASTSKLEIYNDVDSMLVNFFRVLRDKTQFDEFLRMVALTPYSREEWGMCVDTIDDGEDPVVKAWKFYVGIRQSFGGMFGKSWGFSTGTVSCAEKFLNSIELMPYFHRRISRVQIEHVDAIKCLELYDGKKTLFYLDPPYVPETRSGADYKYEMTYQDHEKLISALLKVKGMVILSGYKNKLYETLELANWRRQDFKMQLLISGKTKQKSLGDEDEQVEAKDANRIDCVWLNRQAQSSEGAQAGLWDVGSQSESSDIDDEESA